MPNMSNTPLLLDGTATAKIIREEVAARVKYLKDHHGVTVGLAAVLAGDNPASVTYVNMKRKACEKAGIASMERIFSSEATQSEVMDTIHALNADAGVHGILVQHPMPKHLDEEEILATVSPKKDADGIGRSSLGDVVLGHPS
jgi:methylenetetrahydrofolate dehydrogenase (NADP+) / methenyltetrahydrofolate cyclohydrolase